MAPDPSASGGGSLLGVSRCATCAAALAPDQLYCLSCGARRRDARIAFRDVLASEAAPLVTAPAGSGGEGGWPPLASPLNAGQGPVGPGRITYVPFLATLGLLLLALAVGVWIGRKPVAAVAAPTAAAPAQVIAATTPPATTPADAQDDAAATDSSTSSKRANDAAAPVKDDTSSLSKLDKLSPEEYQKQSQKLPSTVGTGGTPPPKDDKPAGGGSEFEDFN